MNDNYIDTLEKLQQQGLETLRQAQAAQAAAATSLRDFLGNLTGKLPGAGALGAVPSVVSRLNELNSAYAVKLIEQQNAYVSQLVDIFKTTQQETSAAESADQGTTTQK